MNLFRFKCYQPFFIVIFHFVLFSCKQKEKQVVQQQVVAYTCSMHPQIIRNAPGDCPICGMRLVKKEQHSLQHDTIALGDILQPTDQFILSSIPVTNLQYKTLPVEVTALGVVEYDAEKEGSIAARASGRIEKLYIKYRFQDVRKGQKIMDIYSPEVLTAEQNLLFLLEHDQYNETLIAAAKDRLLFLGMNEEQLKELINKKQLFYTITVYSNYTGHIHEAGNAKMNPPPGSMKDISSFTEALPLREGMYVQKGQTIFKVYDPSKAWAALHLYANSQSFIRKGNAVVITAETQPNKPFPGKIDFIEPFLRSDSKTLTARVYFHNEMHIPVGSQVKGIVKALVTKAYWLPESAVISLGMHQVVFLKEGHGFRAQEVTTGLSYQHEVQVINGLSSTDSVALNAEYLVDSESFVQVKK